MPLQSKLSSKIDDAGSYQKTYCPVPLVLKVGCPGREESRTQDTGVRMYCSNIECTESLVPVHQQCFNDLEEKLTKSLKGSGKSRRWTESQCSANLWTRRCCFIDKMLKCKCGNGILRIKKEMANGSDTAAANVIKPKKRQKLPSLNFGDKGQTKEERKRDRELESHFLGVHSDNDEFSPTPNPTAKISPVRKRSSARVQSINKDGQEVERRENPRVPSWFSDEFERAGHEGILKVAKERVAQLTNCYAKRNANKNGSIESTGASSPSLNSSFETGRESVASSSLASDLSMTKRKASDKFFDYVKSLPTEIHEPFQLDLSPKLSESKWTF